MYYFNRASSLKVITLQGFYHAYIIAYMPFYNEQCGKVTIKIFGFYGLSSLPFQVMLICQHLSFLLQLFFFKGIKLSKHSLHSFFNNFSPSETIGTVNCPPFVLPKKEASTAVNTQNLFQSKPVSQFSVTCTRTDCGTLSKSFSITIFFSNSMSFYEKRFLRISPDIQYSCSLFFKTLRKI